MATFTGKTLQAAIDQGLDQLQLKRQDVEVVVVQAGKRGFLGFGRQLAEIQMTAKPVKQEQQEQKTSNQKQSEKTFVAKQPATIDVAKQAKSYIEDVLKLSGIPTTVTYQQNKNQYIFKCQTVKEGLLIGRHGKNINALQELLQTYFNYHSKHKSYVVLDIGDYRKRREELLQKMAHHAATEAIASGRSIALEPLEPFERKIVHQQLLKHAHVKTYSQGKGRDRHIVVENSHI